jgi:hypothetical protein
MGSNVGRCQVGEAVMASERIDWEEAISRLRALLDRVYPPEALGVRRPVRWPETRYSRA